MKPFLVKYRNSLVNVDVVDVRGERFWGYVVYPAVSPFRKSFSIDFCEKICYDQGEGEE